VVPLALGVLSGLGTCVPLGRAIPGEEGADAETIATEDASTSSVAAIGAAARGDSTGAADAV
jgi:hypothetical protein